MFDSEDKILILRRSASHPHFPHHLDFPGGEVERGETPVIAVQREIFEETGMKLPTELVRIVYEEQMSESTIHIVSIVRLIESQPTIQVSWEHDHSEWLSLQEIFARGLPSNPDNYYETALTYLRHNYGVMSKTRVK